MKKVLLISAYLLCTTFMFSQTAEDIVKAIEKEGIENSQLEQLAYELMDLNGPRLVGTPEMKSAHDWAVNTYKKWGITAENQQWGTWKGWQRGITHVDMVSPRVASLHATQLAWNPGTSSKGVTASLITLPSFTDSLSFVKWLPNVKGKIVMVSMLQPTGRPDENWEEYATKASFEKMKSERDSLEKIWRQNIRNTGYTSRNINAAFEKAGAVGIAQSRWSEGFGANKIFSAGTEKIPAVDISLEDYGMLYRMVEHGEDTKIKIVAESKDLGVVPTFNTIATCTRSTTLSATIAATAGSAARRRASARPAVEDRAAEDAFATWAVGGMTVLPAEVNRLHLVIVFNMTVQDGLLEMRPSASLFAGNCACQGSMRVESRRISAFSSTTWRGVRTVPRMCSISVVAAMRPISSIGWAMVDRVGNVTEDSRTPS